jgi:hypothetical protein
VRCAAPRLLLLLLRDSLSLSPSQDLQRLQ